MRVFKTGANAFVTANCLAAGYLRVDPRDCDTPVKVYIATAAPVETMISKGPDGWLLKIRT